MNQILTRGQSGTIGSRELPTVVRAVGISRVATGVASIVAPRATAKLFGFAVAADPGNTAMTLTRMFGSREVVLGLISSSMILSAPDNPARVMAINAVVDALDAVAVTAMFRQSPSRHTAVAVAIPAVVSAVGHTLAAVRHSR